MDFTWICVGFHENLWNPIAFNEILWNSVDFSEILINFMKYFWILCNPVNSCGFYEILLLCKIQLDFMKSFEISWNEIILVLVKLYYILWNPWWNCIIQKTKHMCAYMHHIHIYAPPNTHVHHQIPSKYKIYLVGLPSVLYETPGQNERSVLNQWFL